MTADVLQSSVARTGDGIESTHMNLPSADRSTQAVSAPGRTASADTVFGWDQLFLLAMPFPIMVIAQAAYILG